MRLEEKITVTAGRDGGLQNLEVHGIVTLRISDDNCSKIKIEVANNDRKGIQLQVTRSCLYSFTGSSLRPVNELTTCAFVCDRHIPTSTRSSLLHKARLRRKTKQSPSPLTSTLASSSGAFKHRTTALCLCPVSSCC